MIYLERYSCSCCEGLQLALKGFSAPELIVEEQRLPRERASVNAHKPSITLVTCLWPSNKKVANSEECECDHVSRSVQDPTSLIGQSTSSRLEDGAAAAAAGESQLFDRRTSTQGRFSGHMEELRRINPRLSLYMWQGVLYICTDTNKHPPWWRVVSQATVLCFPCPASRST